MAFLDDPVLGHWPGNAITSAISQSQYDKLVYSSSLSVPTTEILTPLTASKNFVDRSKGEGVVVAVDYYTNGTTTKCIDVHTAPYLNSFQFSVGDVIQNPDVVWSTSSVENGQFNINLITLVSGSVTPEGDVYRTNLLNPAVLPNPEDVDYPNVISGSRFDFKKLTKKLKDENYTKFTLQVREEYNITDGSQPNTNPDLVFRDILSASLAEEGITYSVNQSGNWPVKLNVLTESNNFVFRLAYETTGSFDWAFDTVSNTRNYFVSESLEDKYIGESDRAALQTKVLAGNIDSDYYIYREHGLITSSSVTIL